MMQPMIDMARTEKDVEENSISSPEAGSYPYGLRISLGKNELEKLGIEHSDLVIGGIYHLHAFAKVVTIYECEGDCNISLQITHLNGESEDAENEEAEDDEPPLEKHGYLRYGK